MFHGIRIRSGGHVAPCMIAMKQHHRSKRHIQVARRKIAGPLLELLLEGGAVNVSLSSREGESDWDEYMDPLQVSMLANATMNCIPPAVAVLLPCMMPYVTTDELARFTAYAKSIIAFADASLTRI